MVDSLVEDIPTVVAEDSLVVAVEDGAAVEVDSPAVAHQGVGNANHA